MARCSMGGSGPVEKKMHAAHGRLQWYSENILALSGYSDEARVFVTALRALGLDVRVLQGTDRRVRDSRFGPLGSAAGNDPAIPVVYHTYRHGRYAPHPGQVSIGRTMLEGDRLPQSWVARLGRLAEIWVPGEFQAEVFAASGLARNRLWVIPSPVEIDPSPLWPRRSHKKRPFVFLTLMDWRMRWRKGLDLLLRAYTREFTRGEDVVLVIKTKGSEPAIRMEYGLNGATPRIEVINQRMDRADLLSLYRRADCFVLPTRGEGIGRPFLDAMQTGPPIIATGWGGHTDYLSAANAFLIKYRLVDVAPAHYLRYPGFYGARWAEPDEEDLKRQMRCVMKEPGLARNRALQARRDIRKLAAARVCESVIRRLKHPFLPPARDGGSRSLFTRLFPIHYPGGPGRDEIRRMSRSDFRKPVLSVALAGRGGTLKRAHNYLSETVGAEGVVLLKWSNWEPQWQGHRARSLEDFNPRRRTVAGVVLACGVDDVPEGFRALEGVLDCLPVYVFD